jgi:hypothetical protein
VKSRKKTDQENGSLSDAQLWASSEDRWQRPQGPRRLRLQRPGRLQSAKTWLATQRGRTPAQIGAAYRKRYGVDWPCALQELRQLGVVFDAAWVAQVESTLEGHHRARAIQRAAREKGQDTDFPEDSNEQFAYIAGYTANGVPFGVTWEEWNEIEAARESPPLNTIPF